MTTLLTYQAWLAASAFVALGFLWGYHRGRKAQIAARLRHLDRTEKLSQLTIRRTNAPFFDAQASWGDDFTGEVITPDRGLREAR